MDMYDIKCCVAVNIYKAFLHWILHFYIKSKFFTIYNPFITNRYEHRPHCLRGCVPILYNVFVKNICWLSHKYHSLVISYTLSFSDLTFDLTGVCASLALSLLSLVDAEFFSLLCLGTIGGGCSCISYTTSFCLSLTGFASVGLVGFPIIETCLGTECAWFFFGSSGILS